MLKIETTHEGYTIRWDDYYRKFEIIKEGNKLTKKLTLEECEVWIKLQNKKKWNRVDIFYISRGYGNSETFVKGVATSVIDDEYVWVMGKNNRGKYKIDSCVLDTPDNRATFDKIAAFKAEIAELSGKIKDAKDTFEKLTVSAMEPSK